VWPSGHKNPFLHGVGTLGSDIGAAKTFRLEAARKLA
jgi:hypothetical protein